VTNSDLPPSGSPDARREPDTRSTSRDRAAEDLLAECLALSEEEWSRAVRETCRRRPDLAEPLEQLFRNVHAIDRALQPVESPSVDADGLPIPSTLGDFEVLERVGGGGMGFVYRARQISLKRTVALKLIRPEHLFFVKAKERFRRETEAISRLHHPGIVPLFEAGEEHGLPFFAMEFIEGQSLGRTLNPIRFRDPARLRAQDLVHAYRQVVLDPDRVADEGVFSAVENRKWPWLCCRIVARVAQALDHAHQNGVIHRDIKPSNIMLTDDGRVVIVDFGLAIAEGAESLTKTGSHPGSLPYMSPEQIAGKPIDHRSDIYSLGVTLYELLTLRCPFPLSSPETARRHITSGSFERLRSRNPSVPPEVEAVCLKAMDLDRDRRYATAADFADDLLNAVTHRPIRAHTFSWPRRVKQLILRHPARSLAIGALFLAAVVAPLLFALQQYLHVERLKTEQSATKAAIQRAELSDEESRAATDFLIEMMKGADASHRHNKDVTLREAVIRASSSLEARFRDTPRLQVKLMTILGQVMDDVGLEAEALVLARRAIDIATSRLGPRTAALAPLLLLQSQHEPDPLIAEQLLREAIELARIHSTLGLEAEATAYLQLCSVQQELGKFTEAEHAIRHCLLRFDAASRNGSIRAEPHQSLTRLITANAKLADILRMRGSLEESRRVAIEALHLAERGSARYDIRVLPLLGTLSDIDLNFGNGLGAQQWASEALRITEEHHAPGHPDRLKARLIMAKALAYSGQATNTTLTEIETIGGELHERYGSQSLEYTFSVFVRAIVQLSLSRLREAEASATEALKNRSSPLRVSLLTFRADVRQRLGMLEGAISDAKLALELTQDCAAGARVGPTICLAICQAGAGEAIAAEALLERTGLQIDAEGLGRGQGRVRVDLARAAIIWRTGRAEEGAKLIKECLAKLSGADLHTRQQRAHALGDLAFLYFNNGRLSESIALWKEVADLHLAMWGEGNTAVHDDFTRTAILMIEYGDPLQGLSIAESRAAGRSRGRSAIDRHLSALMRLRQGDQKGALSLLHETSLLLGASPASDAPFEIGAILLKAAEIHAGDGSFEMAEELARSATQAFNRSAQPPAWQRAEATAVLARCLAYADAGTEARALIDGVAGSIPRDPNEGWQRAKSQLLRAEAEFGRLFENGTRGDSRPTQESPAK
jgi:serine/threonine protein kinase